MNVTIRIPSMLRVYCGGEAEIISPARTVRAALEDIERTRGRLYRSICDETGAVRRHVNVFVNDSNIRDLEALDTRLAPGDVITFMPAVSGGSTCRNV